MLITLALILSAFLIGKMQKPSKYDYLNLNQIASVTQNGNSITIYTDTDCYDFTIRRENINMSREMYNYKRKAVRIAKDFRYTTEIIEAIHKAKTENEISNIMRNARLAQEV